MLLPWFQVDRRRGEAPRRWFQWGRVTHYGDYPGMTEAKSWYIILRLPSWVMKESVYDLQPRWHQRCLVFRGELPAGKEEWTLQEIDW